MESLFEPLVDQLIDQTALMQSVDGTLTTAEEVALGKTGGVTSWPIPP